MTKLWTAVILAGSMALGACTNPDRFGAGDDPAVVDPGVATPGIVPGGPSDPTSPQFFTQTVGDRVLFEVDQSTLTAAAQEVLRGQAQWLLTNSDYLAVIEGHADEQGTREYNVALGARRANAVREFLISQGVPASRIQTVSYGKERPIAVCSDESCYAQNRRAVTVISLATIG